jgi:Ser/Thr protein kinase RdoA (MazF antagonist)
LIVNTFPGTGSAFDMTMKLVEPLRALRMIHFPAWIARRWEDSAFKLGFPAFGPSAIGRSKSKSSPCN